MQVYAGTSGFSYTEWRGRFYPEGLPGDRMLAFYSERLPSVEINNTFYRMPKPEMLAAWGEGAPAAFRFSLKATRRITHQQKLAEVAGDLAHFFSVADALGEKLGAVLFQLPPFLKKDLGLLREFLPIVPSGRRIAIEFRHPSWFSDDVYAALAERNVALVAGDLDELEKSPPLIVTANFGYLRLRRLDYDPNTIADWGARIAAQAWQEVYTYFKHEVLGPLFAQALLASMSGQPMADLSAMRASIVAPPDKAKTRGAPAKASLMPSSAPKTRGAPAKTSLVPSSAPKTRGAAVKASEKPTARSTKAPKKRP
jgi:uncharacterized protein YecE (DUF72 family)